MAKYVHPVLDISVWYDMPVAPTTQDAGDIGDFWLVAGSATIYTKTAASTWQTLPTTPASYTAPTATVAALFAFLEATNNGTNKISLTAPASTSANRVHTLADVADGEIPVLDASTTTNKVLKTSGTAGLITESAIVENAGAVSGITSLAMGGALSGVTTLGMSGALSGATSIPASILTGGNAANTADNAVLPALQVVYPVLVTGGANADHDVVITHKTRITGVKIIKKSAAGTTSTITVKNGASAITDAVATVGADNTTYLAATIDDSTYEIAAGGTLRVSSASASADAPQCLVLVEGYRVA